MQCILVFDNHRTNECLPSTRFEKAGFRVLTAHDCETTFQILYNEHSDLLVFNLFLLDHKHWDLLHSIQANPSLTYIPTSQSVFKPYMGWNTN